jgi:hypothetical protein
MSNPSAMTLRLQLMSCSFNALRREGASAPLGIHGRRAIGEMNITQEAGLEGEGDICHDKSSAGGALLLHRCKPLRAKPEACFLEKCGRRSSDETHRLVLGATGGIHDKGHHERSLDTSISLLFRIPKKSGAWDRAWLATVGDYEGWDISEAG